MDPRNEGRSADESTPERPRTTTGTSTNTVTRRKFIGGMAAASAFTILPRHVLGGPGFTAPSDKLNVAQIGCGTQGIRQVTTGLVTREDLQFTCVCDPNTDSQNYVDWSPHGIRDQVREVLEDPTWGESNKGIRAGREVAREIFDAYYGKANRSGSSKGVRSYADFRDLLEQETDLDAVVIITPDHTHATISTAALKKGVAAISHKPVSNMVNEVRSTVEAARASSAVSHLLAYRDREDYYTLDAWFKAGVIGPIREVHNWTFRPVWPQGWLDYPTEQPPVPAGFNWDLWLGPEQHRPYHPNYTFALYRGWYNYGGGSFADMGNYSLWAIYRMLNMQPPVSIEAHANTVAFVNEENVSTYKLSEVAYPVAGTVHFHHAELDGRPPIDLYWYEGGIKPQTPKELLDAGEQLEREGMMFVGDNGKILCGYRGTDPRLIPQGRMVDVEGMIDPEEIEIVDSDDEWINAIKNGGKSRGSFEGFAPLAEATALQGVAYRMSGQRLDWDAAHMKFTNVPEANEFVSRYYRPGWEL